MASDNIMIISDDEFQEKVIQAKQPVLVDFWAEWCAPCRSISPILDELADQYKGKVLIAKINVDDNPKVPADFGVRGIPTLILFNKGEKVETIVGSDTAKIQSIVKQAAEM